MQTGTPRRAYYIYAARLGRRQDLGRSRTLGHIALFAATARTRAKSYRLVIAGIAETTQCGKRQWRAFSHCANAEYNRPIVRIEYLARASPIGSKRRTRTVMTVTRTAIATFHHHPRSGHNLPRVYFDGDKGASFKQLVKIIFHGIYIQKKGKLTTSHRYDPIPLLRSRPGGILGELVV